MTIQNNLSSLILILLFFCQAINYVPSMAITSISSSLSHLSSSTLPPIKMQVDRKSVSMPLCPITVTETRSVSHG